METDSAKPAQSQLLNYSVMGLDLRTLSLDPRLFVHGTDDLPWGARLNNAKRIKLLLVKRNSWVLPFLKWLRHV